MPDQALDGIQVMDLSQDWSGPFCTKWLADFGAEVIKIEPPQGESGRRLGPFLDDEPGPDRSGTFLFLNSNKKSITLDLAAKTGGKIFRRLVESADVVVENFTPGVMAGLGLDYATLETLNPALVMTSISYFGPDGPYRNFEGSDILALALGGLMYVTGEPDREPLKARGSQAEMQAGINAAIATMTALLARDLTGAGQHVDVSVVECIASILESSTTLYSYLRAIRPRAGARHNSAYPSTILPCKDGFVHVHGAHDWRVLAQFIDEPGLLDPEIQAAPRQHADQIDAFVRPWLATRNKAEIFEEAQLWRLPFAMVCSVDEMMDDPQYTAREYFPAVSHPETGIHSSPGVSWRLSKTPGRIKRPSPCFGEHNDMVLGDILGLTLAEREALTREGVTGTEPLLD